MTKSFGTFCRFGSCIVTRPVAVNVSTMLCMRSIPSLLQQVAPRCSGNTTLVKAAVRRRHSRITDGSAWNCRSLSSTSFAVLQTGFVRLNSIKNMKTTACKLADILVMHCVQKKHTLTFSFISPWKMFRLPRNFQVMFTRELLFHRCEN